MGPHPWPRRCQPGRITCVPDPAQLYRHCRRHCLQDQGASTSQGQSWPRTRSSPTSTPCRSPLRRARSPCYETAASSSAPPAAASSSPTGPADSQKVERESVLSPWRCDQLPRTAAARSTSRGQTSRSTQGAAVRDPTQHNRRTIGQAGKSSSPGRLGCRRRVTSTMWPRSSYSASPPPVRRARGSPVPVSQHRAEERRGSGDFRPRHGRGRSPVCSERHRLRRTCTAGLPADAALRSSRPDRRHFI
ncbi:hypothetical protein B0E54_01908 [Micromonospora sp. MH99]|nr:hypothetical protein [Micromonospora sp. MH99]